jgi:hypothetical protein
MATSVPQGSAQIFKFPPRGRYAVGGNDTERNSSNFAAQLAVTVGAGGAWYHDEAVRDDEQPRKN